MASSPDATVSQHGSIAGEAVHAHAIIEIYRDKGLS